MGADTTADSPFEVIETGRGRTYRLPPRKILALRCAAFLPLGIVVILGVFLAKFYVNDVAQRAVNSWYWAFFIVLSLLWAVMTYTMLDVAASFWYGRAEVEIARDGMVSAYDRAGWFSICLSWFKPGDAARLILTEISSPEEKPRDLWSRAFVGLWQLSVEDKSGDKGWLALGYPRETLAALAEQLARELAVAPPYAPDPAQTDDVPATPVAAQAPVPVVAEPGFPNRDVTEQPLKSRVVLERHPDGVTLTFPRFGLKGKILEPFCLGAFIAALFLPLTVAAVVSWIRGNLEFWPGLVIGPGLTAVGLGFMLYSLNAGRKKVVLAVVGDKLLALETGPLGSNRCEYARADLLDIACRPNTNAPNLLIVANDRTAIGMLAGRDEAELKWVATVLRQALGIPSESPEFRKPPDTPAKPWESPQQSKPGEKVAVTVVRNGQSGEMPMQE